MKGMVKYNQKKFREEFNEILITYQGIMEFLESQNNPRDICSIELLKQYAACITDLFSAVDRGKKILWHGFLFPAEIFYGFENLHPYDLEIIGPIISTLNPEGFHQYVDRAERLGLPPEICPLQKGFIGCTLEEIQPPVDMAVVHTTPCDSAIVGYQILDKLIKAPVYYCDMPYWQDERSIQLYSHHVRKMIEQIEEVCQVRMNWDKCREHVKLANETVEYALAEKEMRKLSPCPHPGNLSTAPAFLQLNTSGTVGARDTARFIFEDSKRLAAEKKGALADERIRLLWYNPDPFHDIAIHDWMEYEYGAITVLSLLGHTASTLIDPSTPETIIRDYAWKLMNTTMARQYRGPYEYFMDDFIAALEGWNVDAAIVPALFQCKHGQAMHGFVREACREREIPLLLLEYDVLDSRVVSGDKMREDVAEFLETQVIPHK